MVKVTVVHECGAQVIKSDALRLSQWAIQHVKEVLFHMPSVRSIVEDGRQCVFTLLPLTRVHSVRVDIGKTFLSA